MFHPGTKAVLLGPGVRVSQQLLELIESAVWHRQVFLLKSGATCKTCHTGKHLGVSKRLFPLKFACFQTQAVCVSTSGLTA